MHELLATTLANLEKRRVKVVEGGVNSIPSELIRFSNAYIGTEQKKFYLISAGTKAGKTQIGSYLKIYTPILFAYFNPSKVRVKIKYYAWEETAEEILERFMCFILNKMSKGAIRIAPIDLKSSRSNTPVNLLILNTLNSKEYLDILSFFVSSIEFSYTGNPTGVLKECEAYMKSIGTIEYDKIEIKDGFGNTSTSQKFKKYVQNDPDLYVILFVDHISLISPEKGETLKQAIDKLSDYCIKELRNKYGMTIVIIQQQSADQEGSDNFKTGLMRPSVNGLADSKYTSRNCNMFLGIFSPFRMKLEQYLGYDIRVFMDNIRFVEVVLNRGGSSGDIVPLYFDGAVCEFIELPNSKDSHLIAAVYEKLKQIRNRNVTPKEKLFLAISIKSMTLGARLHLLKNKLKNKWQIAVSSLGKQGQENQQV